MQDYRGFTLTGEMTPDDVVHHIEEMTHHLHGMMMDEGYVPDEDTPPNFSRQYSESTETFYFELTVYGIRGEECHSQRRTTGAKTQKHTQPTK